MSTAEAFKESQIHKELVESFEEKVVEVKLLGKSMERLYVDYKDIFLNCNEQQVKYFALDLIKKVVYLLDRVKLLKTGQCLRKYQLNTEAPYISEEIYCSFESYVRNEKKFPPDTKLSCCSYEGVKYFGSDRSPAQKCMLDNARSDLDELILKHQACLETALWVLKQRSDIIKKQDLEIAVKMSDYVRIVGKSKTVLLDSSVELEESGVNIFQSKSCHRHDIETMTIAPLANVDHWAWLTSREKIETEKHMAVTAFEEKRNSNFVEQKTMAALNKSMGVGTRVPPPRKKINGLLTPAALKSSSSQFLSDNSGFKTTCDTDDGTSCNSSPNLTGQVEKTLFSVNLDRFDNNGSTPMAVLTASGKTKIARVSEVENLDLSEYDDVESSPEINKRMRADAKRKRQEEEEEAQKEEFGDLFVRDGDCESVESGDAPMSLHKSGVTRSKPDYEFSVDREDDAEYNEEEDEIFNMDRYKVIRAVAGVVDSEKKRLKPVKSSPSTADKSKVKSFRDFQGVVKAENPLGVPEVNFKPVSMRKKTKGDYEVSYKEEIEVHVHNKLYSKVVVTREDGTSSSMVIRNPEELQLANKELDVAFIAFLVKHTVTIVGSEIALERCIVDYVLKKQNLNGLSQLEQQEISNWREIFIRIETIISDSARDENCTKKDILDNAMKATIELTENEFRLQRNALRATEEGSLQDTVEAIGNLRAVADSKISEVANMTNGLKMLLDVTLKTTNQKINTAIHYIAMKVCVYWAHINNCLDVIEPALVEKYTTRFLQHDLLKEQLASAEKTGRLLLCAPQCVDQPVAADDSAGALVAEEAQLRTIMDNDHADDLMNAIYSVKAKAKDMISLVEVLWSKTPRTKLSLAVAVKKEGAEKKGKKVVPSSPLVAEAQLVNTPGLVFTNSSSASTPPGAESLTQSSTPGALTQTTLANLGGKLGFSQQLSNDRKETPSSAVSTELPSPAVSIDGPRASAMQLAKKVLLSYDVAIKAILTGLVVQNDTLCLEIDFKNKRRLAQNRLQLFHFLLVNKGRDIDEVLKRFGETENIYDLLNCLFYVKLDGVDGSLIIGDGYCFYRAVYQLYLRYMATYTWDAKDVQTSDRMCNVKDELGSATHSNFVVFMDQLATLVKTQPRLADSTAGELAFYKFQRDCELLTVLLKRRGGSGLGSTKLWGCQSVVSLLNFNVTSLEVLSDKSSSIVEKMLCVDNSLSTRSVRWTRYQASSIPVNRSSVSRAKSALSFQDLDQVVSLPLNPLVYLPGHFTTGATAFTKLEASPTSLSECFHDLKSRLLTLAMERVQIVEDMSPGVTAHIAALVSFFYSTRTDNSVDVPSLEIFDSDKFVSRLNLAFPESLRIKGDTVDLSDEEETVDSYEVAQLKEMLKLNQSKMDILTEHNKMMRDILLAN